jgi:hypothetical protein
MDKYPSWTSGRHHAKCDDSAGLPYSDSDLDIVKITCPDVRFDSTTWWNKQFVDHCPWSAKQFDWYLTQLVPNWDLLAAKAMANANPNTPGVDLPAFIGELKDLPMLMRSTRDIYSWYRKVRRGKIPPSEFHPTLGEANLSYSFGLRPMVSDLSKLFDFTESVRNRIAYLRRLEHGTKVRRSLGSDERNFDYIGSSNERIAYSIAHKDYLVLPNLSSLTGRTDYWYTMRLKLLDELPGNWDELMKLGRDLEYGLYANIDSVWELVPFSWLIDWFSNFGDLINQTRGRVRYQHRDLNIMAESKLECTQTFEMKPGITQSGECQISVERKLRHVRTLPYAYPTFVKPLLSKYQVGILGSLAITRGRKVPRN